MIFTGLWFAVQRVVRTFFSIVHFNLGLMNYNGESMSKLLCQYMNVDNK
jgi:hypothetical protein